MEINLSNKTAIVCGSTQGIGFAIAKLFWDCCSNLILIARNESKLNEIKLTFEENKINNSQSLKVIVADFDNPIELNEKLKSFSFDKVDILVNNTGGPNSGMAYTSNIEDYELAFKRHLICNQILVQNIIEIMKKNKFGRIINIISTSVKQPLDNLGVSNTIRGAVANWSKTLANELGQYNITVNNILPGATSTERLDNIIKNKAHKINVEIDKVTKEMIEEIPLQRFAEPNEIAYGALFLASDMGSYVSGINLPIDGGRLKVL
jgi:3-oxoacyl-[acyl-carrier protein] reductase